MLEYRKSDMWAERVAFAKKSCTQILTSTSYQLNIVLKLRIFLAAIAYLFEGQAVISFRRLISLYCFGRWDPGSWHGVSQLPRGLRFGTGHRGGWGVQWPVSRGQQPQAQEQTVAIGPGSRGSRRPAGVCPRQEWQRSAQGLAPDGDDCICITCYERRGMFDIGCM